MFAAQGYLYSNVSGVGFGMQASPMGLDNSVRRLYRDARSSARLHQLKAALFHRLPGLLNLEANLSSQKIANQASLGIRTVEIESIRGSESRTEDFDQDFCPLQEHTRERWFSVARATLKGTPLPPVELVQVGSDYFVRDGHHRISVARALGQMAVEAEVTVVTVE